MKTVYNALFVLLLLTVFSGCKEEYIGQYTVDSVAPKQVSNVQVQNMKGRVVLTYTLPEEDDLLCVTARYVLQNGVKREMSSSAYSNKIELKGFGKGRKYQVELYSIDKSYNESAPCVVEVEPEDSPIYDVFHTLQLFDAFGGVKLHWENPLKENVVLGAMMKESDGTWKHVETIYSSEAVADKAIRGLDAKPADFAFYFRDIYDNHTDTLYKEMTPLFEEEMDKSKFMEFPLGKYFTHNNFGSKSMTGMWNNVYNVEKDLFYISAGTGMKPYFSFDMGVESKLSRFRLWTRLQYMYRLHHLRTFTVYGTNDAAVTKDPDNWEGWIKLMDCESFRPSGQIIGGEPNAEEKEHMLAGEEWEFPVDVPKVRYLKFQIHTTWGDTDGAFINEISLWGSTK